jgi:hypothetical protein
MNTQTELTYVNGAGDLLVGDEARHAIRLDDISRAIAQMFPNYTTLDRIIWYNLPNYQYCLEDNNKLLDSIETSVSYADFYPLMLEKISNIYLYTAFDNYDLKDFLDLMKARGISVFQETYYLRGQSLVTVTEVWKDTYLFDELV